MKGPKCTCAASLRAGRMVVLDLGLEGKHCKSIGGTLGLETLNVVFLLGIQSAGVVCINCSYI